MFHEYPYSTYYEDVDEICRMCRDLGIRLEVKNDYLRLIDKKGNVISNVKISWAEEARFDEAGHMITSYIINIGADAHKLVINHGDGSVSTVTVPYAEESQTALDCIVELSSIDTGLHYRLGNGDVGTVVPGYSVKAEQSPSGRDIDNFAVSMVQNGAAIDLKDNYGDVLTSLIPAFATRALEDADGDVIDETYGTQLRTGVKTIKLVSKDGELLSEITVPWADSAKYDEDGNEIDEFYGHSIASVNGNLQLKDAHGNVLSTAEVQDFGSITQVSIVGDQIVFTNRAGQTIAVTVPYAVKCQKDSLNNTIANTYIASVQNDTDTGALNFYDATGSLVCTLTPTVQTATTDNYGNTIADYIKSIVVDNQSDYVYATHGDGTVDSLVINYSKMALLDSNNNIIKNTYIKRIEFAEDPDDHHMKLLCYNGDNPEALVCRCDMLVDLSDLPFGKSLDIDDHTLSLLDGNGNTLDSVTLPSEGGGSEVTITPTISTGTKIADYSIDGTTGELYAPSGGGGGSTVVITPTVSTGTKIADYSIDGVSGALYAPSGGSGGGTQLTYDSSTKELHLKDSNNTDLSHVELPFVPDNTSIANGLSVIDHYLQLKRENGILFGSGVDINLPVIHQKYLNCKYFKVYNTDPRPTNGYKNSSLIDADFTNVSSYTIPANTTKYILLAASNLTPFSVNGKVYIKKQNGDIYYFGYADYSKITRNLPDGRTSKYYVSQDLFREVVYIADGAMPTNLGFTNASIIPYYKDLDEGEDVSLDAIIFYLLVPVNVQNAVTIGNNSFNIYSINNNTVFTTQNNFEVTADTLYPAP